MRFADRADAGRRLAERLLPLPSGAVLLGLPRGGVLVAAEVAVAAGVPLEVLAVRKLGVPSHPEVALGAIGEYGAHVLDVATVRRFGVGADELAAVERRERTELARRVGRYRGDRPPPRLRDVTAVIVDDGLATGATAIAACRAARAAGAARVVVAVPVAPPEATGLLAGEADELIAVLVPPDLHAVGAWYERFGDVPDEEVLEALGRANGGEIRPPGALR